MSDNPEKKPVSFSVLKIRLLALINHDPVVTTTAGRVASVLLDELRGPDKVVKIGNDEIGRRIDRGRRQTSEAIGILEGRWIAVKRRKHKYSEYMLPLMSDPAALNERYDLMIQDVRNSAYLERGPAVRNSAPPLRGNPHHRCAEFRAEESPDPVYPTAPLGIHQLLERLAVIAGLDRHSVNWPTAWRRGHETMRTWLSRGWTPALCERVAKKVMRSKRDGPPDTPKYFQTAIEEASPHQTAPPADVVTVPSKLTPRDPEVIAIDVTSAAPPAAIDQSAFVAGPTIEQTAATIVETNNSIEPAISAPATAAPAGRQMLIMQQWSASPELARELVQRLITAAWPHLPKVDRLIHDVDNRRHWSGDRKLSWLKMQIDRIAGDSTYWPALRRLPADTGSQAIIATLRTAPGNTASKDQFIVATGRTAAAISNLTAALTKTGEIVRVIPAFIMSDRSLPNRASRWMRCGRAR